MPRPGRAVPDNDTDGDEASDEDKYSDQSYKTDVDDIFDAKKTVRLHVRALQVREGDY